MGNETKIILKTVKHRTGTERIQTEGDGSDRSIMYWDGRDCNGLWDRTRRIRSQLIGAKSIATERIRMEETDRKKMEQIGADRERMVRIGMGHDGTESDGKGRKELGRIAPKSDGAEQSGTQRNEVDRERAEQDGF